MGRYSNTASFLVMGGAALMAQVLAMRELMAALRGNELSLALTLGLWLLMAGASSWAGVVVARRAKDKSRAFSAGLFAFSLLIPPAVMAPRVLLPLFGYLPGELVPVGGMFLLISSTLIMVAPLAGLMFPFAVGVMGDAGPGQAGKVYAFEAAGSFAAGLALTFIIAPKFTTLQAASLTSVICLLAVALYSTYEGRKKPALAAISFALLMSALFYAAPGIELKIYNRGVPAGRVVEAVQSRYGAITVVELPGQHAVYEGGVYSFSIPDRDVAERKAHLPMTVHKAPSDVLLIGGGGEGVLTEVLKHPVRKLDYVELDPRLIEVSMRYMPDADRRAFADPRVSVHYTDGRHFVKDTSARYDLVMVCLPEPSTASINRYYTAEFFEEVKRILTTGGILSISLPSSPNYIGKRQLALNGSIYHTLKSVFGTVRVTPEDTSYFFAAMDRDAVDLDAAVLARRFEARGITARSFNQHTLPFFLEPGRVAYVEERLSRSAGLGINHDFRPVAYLYSLALWGEVAGLPALDWLAPGFGGRGFFMLYAVPIIVILIALLLIFRRGGLYGRVSFAIATTGLSGMVIEVALLLAYQSYYGYLYERLGLIMALFMLGLFIGSRYAAASLLKLSTPFRGIIAIESGFMLLAIALMLMASFPGSAMSGVSLTAMMLLAGALTGAEYPLALAVSGGPEGVRTGAAGRFYGLDLIGSGAGALLSGLVLIPLLGIAFTAVFVLLLKAVSTGFLLAGGREA